MDANTIYEAVKNALPIILKSLGPILLQKVRVALRKDKKDREIKQKLVDREFEESWDMSARSLSGIIPETNNYLDPDILRRFLINPITQEELRKLVETANDNPDVELLYAIIREEGYEEPMLPNFDLEEAIREFTMVLDSNIQRKEHLGKIPAVERRRTERAAEMSRYLHLVAEFYGRLDFVGIAVPGGKRELRLEDIFLMPQAQKQMPEADEFRMTEAPTRDDLPPRRAWKEEMPSRLSNILRDNIRLVILGSPGSGKTTVLRYVALKLAQGKALKELGLRDDLVPIYVELSKFAERDDQKQSFADFIYRDVSSRLNAHLSSSFFETYLIQRKCIVLLDGLDEVATLAQRADVKNAVLSFGSRYQGNRFVVTSRMAGYNEVGFGMDFAHFSMCDLIQDDIEHFAYKWYKALEGNDETAQERARDLVKSIRSNSRIAALARNPLMLTIIALSHRMGATLPNQRVRLYEECIETLLYTWDAARKPISEAERRRMGRQLARVAYSMHNMPGSGKKLIRFGQLQYILTQLLKKDDDAGETETEARFSLDQILKRTGILVEGTRDIYSFAHPTFEGYFAARDICQRFCDRNIDQGLFDKNIDDLWKHELRPHLHDPRWREVTLLVLGMLSNQFGEPVTSTLVRRIWKNGTSYERILYRDLFLAGQCLADDILVDESLAKKILKRISDLLDRDKGRYLSLRSNAARILASMHGSKYEEEAVRTLNVILRSGDESARSNALMALGSFRIASKETMDAFMRSLDNESVTRPRAIEGLIVPMISSGYMLFDVSLECQSNLEKGTIPEDLRKEFGDKKFPLSNSASVSTEEMNNRWLITDPGKTYTMTYTIRRSEHCLEVYVNIIDAFIQKLSDEYWVTRANAAEFLGRQRIVSTYVVDALIRALSDQYNFVRASAASALGHLGSKSRNVRDALIKALVDDYANVRTSAASALGRLGNRSRCVRDALIAALGDRNDHVRSSAVEALGELGAVSANAIEALMEALADRSDIVRSNAVEALGRLGSSSADIVDVIADDLIKALSYEHWHTRASALEALGRLGSSSADVICAIRVTLDDGDWRVRFRSVETLGKLAQEPADVLLFRVGLDIQEVLDNGEVSVGLHQKFEANGISLSDNTYTAVEEADSKWSINDGDKAYTAKKEEHGIGICGDVIDFLLKHLTDRDPIIRSKAAEVLGRQRNVSEYARNALIETLLNDKESHVRSKAAEALGQLGDTSEDVMSNLIKAIDGRSWEVRHSAAESLGRLVVRSDEAMDGLLNRLDAETHPYVADAIFNAIYHLATLEATK